MPIRWKTFAAIKAFRTVKGGLINFMTLWSQTFARTQVRLMIELVCLAKLDPWGHSVTPVVILP